jgi:hypothetical protein
MAQRVSALKAAASRAPSGSASPGPTAPAPSRPPATAEEIARSRLIGLAAIGGAAVIALVVTVGIFLPALGTLTSGGIRPVEAASLPGAIVVCGHNYSRSTAGLLSIADIRAADGRDPVVAGPSSSCPTGVCVANGACLDQVYVATTDGRFASYALVDEST